LLICGWNHSGLHHVGCFVVLAFFYFDCFHLPHF
jgi:hypothetical protein